MKTLYCLWILSFIVSVLGKRDRFEYDEPSVGTDSEEII